MMENKHERINMFSGMRKVMFKRWCDDHCNFEWFVKNDGKVYSTSGNINFKNKKTIRSFPVRFGDCKNFDCSYCKSLKSLEGAPMNVSVGFDCSYCYLLKSLRGTPKNVGGDFDCFWCTSLKTLKGSPENVGGNFDCAFCESLVLLKGVSKTIGGYFYYENCKSLEFIDELKNIKIGKKIYYDNCPKLEKYDLILGDMNVFRKWQKSEYTADEFMKEYDGFLQAQKYGI